MDNKDLKQMNRKEILEMLLTQAEENERLKKELEEADKKLEDRRVTLDKVGSIAEASLQLSGIFESAQEAVKIYVDSIHELTGQQEEICDRMRAEAEKKASEIINEAESYSTRVHAEADNYWKNIQKQAEALLVEHETLRKLIVSVGKEDCE